MRQVSWRGAAAIGAVLVVTLAACAGEPSKPASPSGSPSPSASGAANDESPIADPSHAVDIPGKREGTLHSTDLLILSEDTLSSADVKKIRGLDGVSGVEQISMAQVSVEGRLVKVVAVDPATYRNFAPFQSADSDEVWQRVAGGEVAIDPERQDELPADKDGFVRLGSKKDAASVHVGAYAPQPPGLAAAVVNHKWGEEMGMEKGNALIVSTAAIAPNRVVKPIQTVVGSDASVQRLDVVARAGLDPNAPQKAYVVGTVAEAVGNYTYRANGDGTITPASSWVSSHIVTAQVPILGSVTCNKVMIPQLRAALQEVVDRGLAKKINPSQYAGCFYPRFIANTTQLSNHAFGTAVDLNTAGNQRGTVGEMDRTVVSIFERWGFTWGGNWKWTDPMHFEMNRIVKPG
ncbi:M15 family metallopeptidase [Nocardioides sp. NBC_00163]|uniref:M15 family metallopeptidase n=1 Tax=Nocardioides sp. NBC_00163 TaxID=2975999 RepID=UPI00324D9310